MGLKPYCFEYVIKKHSKAQIVICVDNDTAGDKFYSNILSSYSKEYDLGMITRLIPMQKDWNEDLKKMKAAK